MNFNIDDYQIGNWVIYLPEGNYCQVKSMSSMLELQGAIRTINTKIENVKAIEITEDKLQVLGFEIQFPFFVKRYNDLCLKIVKASASPKIFQLYCNEEKYGNVRFIHQVQNAYYKITGRSIRGNLFGVREG